MKIIKLKSVFRIFIWQRSRRIIVVNEDIFIKAQRLLLSSVDAALWKKGVRNVKLKGRLR